MLLGVQWPCCLLCQVQRAVQVPVVCAPSADNAPRGLGTADGAQGEGGRAGSAVAVENTNGLPCGQPTVLRSGEQGEGEGGEGRGKRGGERGSAKDRYCTSKEGKIV